MTKNELILSCKKRGLNPKLIDLIILKNCKITRKELFFLREIEENQLKKIFADIKKLEAGVPIEYIVGKANFFGIDFIVDKNVLIPRNDTEILVKKVLEIPSLSKYSIVDIGTGSLSIIGSIFKNNYDLETGIALDISEKALKIAKKNLKNLELDDKIKLFQSDLLENFLTNKYNLQAKNIIFTANLPYIKNGDFSNMSKETLKYEPSLALFGGEKTGFELYEKLIGQIFELKVKYSLKKVILFIEIGFDQANYCRDFLGKNKLKFKIFKDNSGIDRCVKIVF